MMPNAGNKNHDAAFVTHGIFRERAFGTFHPLSIARHSTLLELCKSLGWLDESRLQLCDLPDRQTLERFHDPRYLDALEEASRNGKTSVEAREKFGLGTAECPIFEGLWDRARATVGGSILTAQLALEGIRAFHPAGGTHHGKPGSASGFCYLNDVVFAILTLLDAGVERMFYVDLDAHHGDGVQAAFEEDPRVFTLSIHEQGRWPHSGPAEDRGLGRARNIPAPRGLNDSEFALLIGEAVLPIAKTWQPQAVVITCGADALAGDPLSGLELSNGALCGAAMALAKLTPHAVVLGGGGYNPWTTARAWARLWGELSGQAPVTELPRAASMLLESLDCDLVDSEDIAPWWTERLDDPPNTGPVREEIRALIRTVMS